MAKLLPAVRKQLFEDYMRDLSNNRVSMSLTKPDLESAINAMDDYQDSNTATRKAALPSEAQTALSNKQIEEIAVNVNFKRMEAV